ncbi:hypothetical protein CRG98_003023 [Punica granatum]|uniref:Uncharacterized protein n=1 Tax=Punica granatum TaxID=22663 RepID=A0A2I0L780_PUNGR|nr:hypothetical protein CRG98_003023 [Punica granatum]
MLPSILPSQLQNLEDSMSFCLQLSGCADWCIPEQDDSLVVLSKSCSTGLIFAPSSVVGVLCGLETVAFCYRSCSSLPRSCEAEFASFCEQPNDGIAQEVQKRISENSVATVGLQLVMEASFRQTILGTVWDKWSSVDRMRLNIGLVGVPPAAGAFTGGKNCVVDLDSLTSGKDGEKERSLYI